MNAKKMDYSSLKDAIFTSAEKVGKTGTDFKINLKKLNEILKPQHLIALPIGLNAHRIEETDIALFAEYYRIDKLVWLNRNRFVTSLAFVDTSRVDDEFQELYEQLCVPRDKNPDIDHVVLEAQIVSNYYCYFALIASYQSDSPGAIGMNSYFITCRANKKVINDPEYVYNPEDIV